MQSIPARTRKRVCRKGLQSQETETLARTSGWYCLRTSRNLDAVRWMLAWVAQLYSWNYPEEGTMTVKTLARKPAAGGTNRLALENEIQDYAAYLLSDHVVKEYKYVLGEWKKYINRVVDAEKEAQANFEKILNHILSEPQKAQQMKAQDCALRPVAGGGARESAGSRAPSKASCTRGSFRRAAKRPIDGSCWPIAIIRRTSNRTGCTTTKPVTTR